MFKCDVGAKSVLRSVSDFYSALMFGTGLDLEANEQRKPGKQVQLLINKLFATQDLPCSPHELFWSLVAFLDSGTNKRDSKAMEKINLNGLSKRPSSDSAIGRQEYERKI